jgi:hypothetical protein
MYRRVPTAAQPAPPLHPLGANAVWNLDTLATVPSGNLAAAPVYMTAEGQIISTF